MFRLIRTVGWTAFAAVALAMLTQPGSSVAQAPKAGPAPSLEMMPADAMLFLHFRVADLRESPFGKQLRAALAKEDPQGEAEIEKNLGVPVSNLATITMIQLRLDSPQPRSAVLFTTASPFNKDKLLEATKATTLHANATGLDVYPIGRNEALVLIGDRTFCRTDNMSPDEAAAFGKAMQDRVGQAAAGPMKPAIDRAAGKVVGFGLNVKGLPPLPPGFQLPPPFDALSPLLKAELITGTADIAGSQLAISAHADFPGAAEATAGEAAVKAGLKLLNDFVGQVVANPPKDANGKLVVPILKEVQTALGKAEVSRDQNAVVAKMATPALASRSNEMATAIAAGIREMRESADRARDSNNLKQIVLAMHNFNDATGNLPAHAIYSKDGKPLLSWRVAILPYIEQDQLYKEFRLDEPWDSEHNKKLIPKMPQIYVSPKSTANEPGRTHYQVFVGGGAPWQRGAAGPNIPRTFVDGTSNTIMIAEAGEAVPWTKPDDLPYDPAKPLPKLGLTVDKSFLVAMADGSVRWVKRSVTEKTLRAAITAAGGEILGPDWNE
jgi:hypothetical protein